MYGLVKIAMELREYHPDDPEWQELAEQYEEKSNKVEEIANQFSPDYRDKGTSIQAGLGGTGAVLGGLTGLGVGIGKGVEEGRGKSLPKRLGYGLMGTAAGLMFGAPIGMVGAGITGSALGEPFYRHYENKTRKANPELWKKYEEANQDLVDYERVLDNYERDNYLA